MIHFVTLFDINFSARGLALIRSLQRLCSKDFTVTVLCMDDEAEQFIASLDLPQVHATSVDALDDHELLALRDERPRREFCWSCTPSLLLHRLATVGAGDVVAYVDADLLFYGDPSEALTEFGEDGEILIHEHRYSPDKAYLESSSGRFNVGLVGFRPGEQALACLRRWREQVLHSCELDPENGLCGDQGYLNEWPERYSKLKILQHLGGGVAPWNVTQYAVTRSGGRVYVDGVPLIFYHFHGLAVLQHRYLLMRWVECARGYLLDRSVRRFIYVPYLRELAKSARLIRDGGWGVRGEVDESVSRAKLKVGAYLPYWP